MRDNRLVSDIKSSLNIADIIGRYTSLRRSGRSYSGLCPFHDERTPSFHVYTDTQTYYCFGCHEAGDIFTFVMKKNGLTFPEALETLAEQAGIDTSKYKTSPRKRERSLYDIMDMAGDYFRDCLKRLPGGRAYLERRGITVKDAENFGLGYAPDSWDGLIQAMHRKGVNDREMIDAGLVIENEKGIYDRFRGRVIFPVQNLSGRITAFGGRAVAESPAKYINSPESDIYHKRSSLYLINRASSSIREKQYSILCEGYMDALRLHKAGFTESVATLGTSLTEEQANLLKRFADMCYICYDTDSAGINASVRGMYILAENGLDVRIVSLPNGKDPDEFLSLSTNPHESFIKAMNESLPLIKFHIEALRPMLENQRTKKNALRELWEGVKRVPAEDALKNLTELSTAFMIPHDEMRSRILNANGSSNSVTVNTNYAPEAVVIDNALECAFCSLLMRYRECRLRIKPNEIYGLLTDSETQFTAEALLNDNPDEMMNLWRAIGDNVRLEIIAKGDMFLSEVKGEGWQGKWERVLSDLEALRVKRRIAEISAKLTANTATHDEAAEFSSLMKTMETYRNQ